MNKIILMCVAMSLLTACGQTGALYIDHQSPATSPSTITEDDTTDG